MACFGFKRDQKIIDVVVGRVDVLVDDERDQDVLLQPSIDLITYK